MNRRHRNNSEGGGGCTDVMPTRENTEFIDTKCRKRTEKYNKIKTRRNVLAFLRSSTQVYRFLPRQILVREQSHTSPIEFQPHTAAHGAHTTFLFASIILFLFLFLSLFLSILFSFFFFCALHSVDSFSRILAYLLFRRVRFTTIQTYSIIHWKHGKQ